MSSQRPLVSGVLFIRRRRESECGGALRTIHRNAPPPGQVEAIVCLEPLSVT